MTRLRQRMIEDMEVRNFVVNTQLSCLQQVSGFAMAALLEGRAPPENRIFV